MITPLVESEKKRIAPLHFVYFNLFQLFFQGGRTAKSCKINKFMDYYENAWTIMDDLSKMHKRTRESALEFSNDFVQNNGNESQILPERKEGDPDTSQGHERRSILLG